MVRYVDKECAYCGKKMIHVAHSRKYCNDCRKKAENDRAKIHYKSRKNRVPIVKHTPYYGDFSQCKTCKYRGIMDNSMKFCDYFSIVGQKRPSKEPSPNCTSYEKGKPDKKTKIFSLH